MSSNNRRIKITNFINPHLFWYHYAAVPDNSYTQIKEIEQKLQKLCADEEHLPLNEIEIGQNVTVYYLPWNKYIRCEVLSKSELKVQNSKCHVWAIDHGFPILTSKQYIKKLPTQCSSILDHIRCGGLANIVPAELEFNFVQLKPFVTKQTNWSQQCSDIVAKLLNDSKIISFTELFTTYGAECQRHWGLLHIRGHMNEEIEVGASLIKWQKAIGVSCNFQSECEMVETISTWLANNGGNNCKHNVCNKDKLYHTSLMENDLESGDIAEMTVEEKITAWQESNDKGSTSFSNTPTMDFENYESQIQFFALGGIINKKMDEKYCSVPTPRQPEPSDFEVITTCSQNVDNGKTIDPDCFHRPNMCRRVMASDVGDITESNKPKIPRNGSIGSSIENSSQSLSRASMPHVNRRQDYLRELRRKIIAMEDTCSQQDDDHSKGTSNISLADTGDGATAQHAKQTKRSVRAEFLKELRLKVLGTLNSRVEEVNEISANKCDVSRCNEQNHIINKSVLLKKPCISDESNEIADKPEEVKLSSRGTEKERRTYDVFNILPAGYDISSRAGYKNKNHWHCVPSTLNQSKLSDIENEESSECYYSIPTRLDQIKQSKNCTDQPANNTHIDQHPQSGRPEICLPETCNNAVRDQSKSKDKEHEGPSIISANDDHAFRTNPILITQSNSKSSEQRGRDDIQYSILQRNEHNKEEARCDSSPMIFEASEQNIDTLIKKLGTVIRGRGIAAFCNNGTIKSPRHQRLPTDICRLEKFSVTIDDTNVLVHCRGTFNRVHNLWDVFPPHIVRIMHDLNLKKIYRIQAYAWSNVKTLRSMFIVNAANTGRTWSYIPLLCTAVQYGCCKSSQPARYGPKAIVIVPSTQHVEEVTVCCRRFFTGSEEDKVVPAFGIRNLSAAKLELMDSCHILVATPGSLLRILEENDNEPLIEESRLAHLVIDNMDFLLEHSKNTFEQVLAGILKIKRKSKTPMQMIAISTEWGTTMKSLMQQSDDAMVLIGNFLEAAVYGSVNFSIKMSERQNKMGLIIQFVERQFSGGRLVIFCREDNDVSDVLKTLKMAGYPCLSFNGKSSVTDLEVIDKWKQINSYNNEILICTDNDFHELQIENAHNIIHYTMPSTWTKFTKRFSVLVANLQNPFSSNFAKSKRQYQKQEQNQLNCLVLLDEENNKQLPRLVDFLNRHGHAHHIPKELSLLVKRISMDIEQNRIQLCPRLLGFGNCVQVRCIYRHKQMLDDLMPEYDDVPSEGDLRIALIKVFSPIWFAARLMQYKAPGDTKWRDVRNSNGFASFAMRINLYYTNLNNCIPHWPINVHDLCVVKIEEFYHRCKILDLVEPSKMICNTTVYLVDEGTVMANILSTQLLAIDKQFISFPKQAFHIRLLDVVPYDDERIWGKSLKRLVEGWLMHELKKDNVVQVTMKMKLANTIWVSCVVVMEKLNAVDQYITVLNLKRSLISKNFAVRNEGNGIKIREFLEDYKLLNRRCSLLENEDVTADVANQDLIAFSDQGEISANLIELSSVDETMSQTDSIKNPRSDFNLIEKEHISEKTSNTNTSNLNLSREVEKSAGDIANKDFISNTREQWSSLILEKLTPVNVHKDMNINWQSFFVYRLDNIDPHREEAFDALLKKYIIDDKEKVKVINVDGLQLFQNCIIKLEKDIFRAKVSDMCGDYENRVIRFLLCDIGSFVTVNVDRLDGILFEMTDEILEFMPFQAIHCSLIGIDITKNNAEYQLNTTLLFAYAIREQKIASDIVNNLHMNSYEILLYESDNDMSAKKLVNRSLLEQNMAKINEETGHFLDIQMDTEIAAQNKEVMNFTEQGAQDNLQVVSFDSFIQLIEKHFQIESEQLRQEKLIGEVQKPKLVQKEKENIKSLPCKPLDLPAHEQSETLKEKEELPRLKFLHKRPKTSWYQTDFLICCRIYAPDIEEYRLEVKPDSMIFNTMISGEPYALYLTFLGRVNTNYIAHEIRGLHVVIFLLKSIPQRWPRLVIQPEKRAWLTYNMDVFLGREIDELSAKQCPLIDPQYQQGHKINIDEDSSSDENENPILTNFVPIINKDDHYDPLTEII